MSRFDNDDDKVVSQKGDGKFKSEHEGLISDDSETLYLARRDGNMKNLIIRKT